MSQPTASASARVHLAGLLEHLSHLLPAQGPIGVFVHHNTLHAFEDRPFEQAVLEAAALYDAEPYLREEVYREHAARGRITRADLNAVLAGEPDACVVDGLTRRRLRIALLDPGVLPVHPATVRWRLEEGDLAGFGPAGAATPLLDACLARTAADAVGDAPRGPADRVDADVHPWVIRLCATYLDQGLAYWPMPGRQHGFYRAVRDLFALPGMLLASALAGADRAFAAQAAAGLQAEDVVLGWLDRHAGRREWRDVLQQELLALPGWAGLFAVLERQPALAPHLRVRCRLVDFLAVRLTLDEVARRHRPHQPPSRRPSGEDVRLARAAWLAGVARVVALDAATIASWPPASWAAFVREVEAFSDRERRRVWHAAYEWHHEQDVLRSLASHRQAVPPRRRPHVAAQLFFCIDEREESMRRAVEETDPTFETFGAAGFFGVAVNYQGIDDAQGVALAPIAVTPEHAVAERPLVADAELHATRVARRRLMGTLTHALGVSSRTLLRGWISTAALGLLSGFPLVGRVLAPRAFGRLRTALNDAFLPEPRTELTLMRDDAASQERVHGLLQGFAVDEKAARVASVLGPAGLTRDFARLIVMVGHGSTSLNNPHESAYDCGACGGRRGGPNARLFAAMANLPAVRQALRAHGIDIGASAWFVGGYHDTCSDDVQLFDVEAVPASHVDDLRRLREVLDHARARNAHERARRFASCRLGASERAALVHVEERAEHLAQPRPEYGHGSNAVCIVGRRALTEGLFLDRRAFLVSYDAASDPDGRQLAGLLAAAVPVCAGISLEYYFSSVDNERYGCGTKLPHNVTALVGVMNGQGSDLRTGLPWQTVEIHEPVRILFVLETTIECACRVLQADAALERLVRHRWIRLATLAPDDGVVHVWRDGRWEGLDGELPRLPVVRSSREWYQGRRDHLPPVRIRPRDDRGSAAQVVA